MWYKENRKVKKIVENVQSYLVIEDDKYQVKEDIIKENEDTVGWIKIEGTNINYPVVQGKDNDYYLKHDYNKNNNSAGWIFMDYLKNNIHIKYEIFSVYSDLGDGINPSDNDIKRLKEKSLINFNNLGEGQIITLVTCHNNNQDKLIINGVKKLT